MFDSSEKIETLIEAIPYVKKFKGKTIVVKYGGHAMVNEELKKKVIQDITFLKFAGLRPVVVHGGGPEITAMLKKIGKESAFVNGLRVTDEETMDVAEMVLVGKINSELVGLINAWGTEAIGLNGKDGALITAEKSYAEVTDEQGNIKEVDIGFVGEIKEVNIRLVNSLLDAGYIPIIAPVGMGADGESFNINADLVAGEIAKALKAEKLLMLTDVRGIFEDFKNPDTFVSTLSYERAHEFMVKGIIDGGMIPKVQACFTALSGGASKTHIIDGRQPHSILMEVFTDKGIGTEVVK